MSRPEKREAAAIHRARSVTALPSTSLANEVRLEKAAARARVEAPRDTAAGMAQLAVELEAGGRWPKRLRVEEILHWPYKSQPAHRDELLRRGGPISETRTVASLTAREVGALCDALRNPELWRGGV